MLGTYIVIVGLMTLTFFQGHRYGKYKLQIACFGFMTSDIAIFSEAIDLYPFILLSVTLIVFQGYSSVKQF